MRAEAAMTRDVVVMSPSVSVAAAGRVMERRHIRHLPVVDQGRLVGILSDRDVLACGGDLPITCGEAMTPAPVSCSPLATVGRLAELMLTHKIDSIPIVADEQLVGLVTSTDLLQLLVERAEAQRLPFDFRVYPWLSEDAADEVA
jgi:acetoin utilization protein AcuB